MAEKFIIKRNWKDTVIRVELNNNGVSVEAPLDSVIERIVTIIKRDFPLNELRWSVKEATLTAAVENVLRAAWMETVREMKTETNKVA